MMVKRVQAKHISDEVLLGAIVDATRTHYGISWASTWDVQAALPEYPPKVVLAKLRSAVKRGLIAGNASPGCRGDFEILNEGE